MGAGMAGGFSLWRSTRWLRRGLRRGLRAVSFGLAVAGTVAAAVETVKRIKKSGDSDEQDPGGPDLSQRVREMKQETQRMEQEIQSLKRKTSEQAEAQETIKNQSSVEQKGEQI